MNKIKQRSAEWFEKKLYDFFVKRYADCKNAEFYKSPHENQYVFDFPDRKQRYVLTCGEDGSIEERVIQYTIKGLENSAIKLYKAEEKAIDYNDMLESGKNGALTVTTIFHKAMPEEVKKREPTTRWNPLKSFEY